jgi:hypothetical protein
MNEVKTVKLHCLSETLSPLTHMMGVQGNEAVLNRTKVMCGGHIYDVPVISGNAIRHKMVREPGAAFLVEVCGLAGRLSVEQANFLYYGGSLTESAIADNLRKIAEMQEIMPLIRLLGGSLTNQVLAGSLLVSEGVLICEENLERLQKLLPIELFGNLQFARSAEEYIGERQYTRGDACRKPELLDKSGMEEKPDKSNQMIYGGQTIIPGALFYHSFILQNVSRLEVGALFAAFEDWEKEGGIIGGSSRIGHGKLSMSVHAEGEDFYGGEFDGAALAEEYRAYTRGKADKIAAWLAEAFPAKKPKEPKEKSKAEARRAIADFFAEQEEMKDGRQ